MAANTWRLLALACLCGFAAAAAARAAQSTTAPAPPAAPAEAVAMSADECAVWARERSFARALADHDAAAFAEHLHPGAVFIDGPQALRGAAAVSAGWAPLVQGKDVRLTWTPDQVVIGGDPDTALSMGPYLLENLRPGANPRYRTGRYISTWKREAGGTWRVLFDGGGGNVPRSASDADRAAVAVAMAAPCPRT